MTRATILAGIAILAGLVTSDPASASGTEPVLGQTDFAASSSPEARPALIRGVLLLHSFEYEDAREAFHEARTIDPGTVMAYWGEAMTYNHPLWREQDADAARAVLAELAPTPAERRAKAPTERERGYLEALDLLYGEGGKAERDAAYSQAMCRLRERFPADLDAAAWCALSILGTAEGERDFATYMRAAAVAEEVFAANPQHPGAAHYLIHSYDDPIHAPLGLRAARVYAQIAPAATHAQHMISHIYTALGWWREASSADEKALAVSEDRLRRKGLPLSKRTHHSLHWLQYSYLQQGRYAEAKALLATMDEDAAADPNSGNRWYQIFMRAGYAVETGRWNEVVFDVDATDTSPAATAAQDYARGVQALERGDRAAAEATLADLRQARQAALAADKDLDEAKRSSSTAHGSAAVMEHELAGLVALAAGRTDGALAALAAALAAEDALASQFGPPQIVKPSHELMGEVLLRLERPKEAVEHFEAALRHSPRRAAALAGLVRALRESGDPAGSERAAEVLASVRELADPSPPPAP